jgi:leucyl aminopeptidase
MQIIAVTGEILRTPTGLAVIPIFEEEPLPTELSQLIEPADIRGRARQTALLYPRGSVTPQRILLVGLGRRDALDAEGMRQFGALAVKQAHDLQQDELGIGFPATDLPVATAAQALAEGLALGTYRYLQHKSDLSAEQSHQIEQATILCSEADQDAVKHGADQGAIVARGVAFARDLANGPGNLVTPTMLADTAGALGERLGLQVTVFDRQRLEAEGFGGIMAVGKGSANEPRFIVMEHGQAAEGRPTICLVGKGITFDTGGISIKPAENMDNMKMDMGGAAAVFGAMQAVAELQLPLHVIGLVAAAENMPSATAYKPGDIITTLSGKTIEVLNTDAEGRIVLADALFYAQRYQPAAVVDLATLTGAVMVALGPHAIGLMGTSQELADRLLAAGQASGERAWQLPLWNEYREMMKSEIADLKNSGGRYAGSITAGAFLSAFTDYPWIHLDIAGTAWSDKPARPYQTRGATGVGVRLLVTWLQSYVQ